MKKLIPLTFSVLLLASCGKMNSYTCYCKFYATPGVPNNKDITETSEVKARTYEKAASKCQVDNRFKYQNQHYSQGVCVLK